MTRQMSPASNKILQSNLFNTKALNEKNNNNKRN